MMKLMMITVCMACIAAVLVPVDAAIPKHVHAHHARPLREPMKYQAPTVNEVRDIETGSCGDDCSWVLNTETGLLTVSGTGKLVDNSYSAYEEYITSLVINDGITFIGNEMFYKFEHLVNATIANTVSFLGSYAFYQCYALSEVNIPNSVTFISPYTFQDCSSLKHITIPDSVIAIGDSSFYGTGLESITLPESVAYIDYGAFIGCYSLNNVSIPDSILYIGDDAFALCNGLRYSYKDGVRYLGNPTNPYVYLVSGDNSLTSVIITSDTKIIGNEALYYSSITQVTIPDSVVYVGWNAFPTVEYYEENHMKYLGNSENPYHVLMYTDGDSEAVINNKTKVLAANSLRAFGGSSLTIPDSVICIGEYAFYQCDNLKNLTLPRSITFIPYVSLYEIGVSELEIPNTVAYISCYAATWSTSLTSVTIGSGVIAMGSGSFSYNRQLTDVCYTGSKNFDYDFMIFDSCYALTEVKVRSKYNYSSFAGKNVIVNSSCVECMVGNDCAASVPMCRYNDCVDSCGDGMYADDENVCQLCNATCRTCENEESCTGCFDGKVLKDGECVDSCGDGMYADANNVCQQCKATCKTCENGESCTECIEGKVFKNGECVDSCGDGMYADDQKKCQECSMSDCKVCTATECTECNSGFQVQDGKCAAAVDSAHAIGYGFAWFICCCAVIIASF